MADLADITTLLLVPARFIYSALDPTALVQAKVDEEMVRLLELAREQAGSGAGWQRSRLAAEPAGSGAGKDES